MENRAKAICAALAYYNIHISYQITPNFDIILYDTKEFLCHTHDTDEGHQWESVGIDFKSLRSREIGKMRTIRFLKNKKKKLRDLIPIS